MSEKNGSAKPDLAVLREEIKQTRAELGETVQALAARADVKARAREQVEHTKERVLTQAAAMTGRVREKALVASERVRGSAVEPVRTSPFPTVLVVAGLAAVVGVILIVRGRR
ncbi:DUF3618 domain-containing protein [Actinoplanes sp. NPDC024001]|uniref:DUF3618 domain-containing protein n=1 Tax=Actinoplanes sp. NPDC024001 TaxID=3154598 RepID=UPI003406667B